MSTSADPWPELPYAAWKDTCATLQLWTQIVGKIRLALTPWLHHSWHVALHVTSRGLSTAQTFFSKELGEFQSTYDAAADLAKWDRADLECGLDEPGRPRAV